MKKLVSVLLVVALCLSLVAASSASSIYNSVLVSKLDVDIKSLAGTSSGRAPVAALIMLDFMLSSNNTDMLSSFSSYGTSYICVYGSSVDVYYSMTSGGYRNLFYSPSTGKITDYGMSSSKPTSGSYTYYSVSNSTIMDKLGEYVDILAN